MIDLLLDFPLQLPAAIQLGQTVKLSSEKGEIEKIVFVGVGGSAIGARVIKAYLYAHCKIPVIVCAEYELPAFVDAKTLVFISSYSGNTEETLSGYQQARAKGAFIVVITSNGALAQKASADNQALVIIPGGLPARAALGYLAIIPLLLLSRLGIISDIQQEVLRTQAMLDDLKKNHLHPRIGLQENIAKNTARRLKGKIALIYASSIPFDVCAMRLRNQINENAKSLAWSNVFPEMNHNEIMGWQNPSRVLKHLAVVMLRDNFVHPRVAKRMDITKEMLKEAGAHVQEIWSHGELLLERIFSLIYIGDFISYYLALHYNVDPTAVDNIQFIKNKLAKG